MTTAPHRGDGLVELERRLGSLRRGRLPADEALAAELGTCEEELRALLEQSAGPVAEPSPQPGWPMDGLPVAAVLTDRVGGILQVNAEALELLGLRAEHATSKPLPAYVALRHRPLLRTALHELAEAGRGSRRVRLELAPRAGLPHEVLAAIGVTQLPTGLALQWVLLPAAPGQPAPAPQSPDVLAVAAAYADLAAVPVVESTGPARLPWQRIAEIAVAAVPGAAHVTITGLDGRGDLAALGASSGWARRLNREQARLAEGPAVDALRQAAARSAVAADAARRWPRWHLSADPRPAAVLALPFDDGTSVVGSLAVYADEECAEGPVAHLAGLAPLLGAYATAVGSLLTTRRRTEQSRTHARQLQEALESRAVIDQAKGIIMIQRGCSADEAFAALVEVSQRRNVRVRVVAQQLVDSATARSRR
ncbi:ANTAR domain-containing protein [Motilibacter aurantiacus]|uniref:ANTAR domain-containing protein n=1 Tax=Motilibacter aurantiacus TaxID=2714955 RepID=UPI00140ACF01|nr:ANTAR domain-containing protein [Motilibacter aurantiacus]NHC44837.1 ANTAR domain-containing protein [Motilibacter aurantiacus]